MILIVSISKRNQSRMTHAIPHRVALMPYATMEFVPAFQNTLEILTPVADQSASSTQTVPVIKLASEINVKIHVQEPALQMPYVM